MSDYEKSQYLTDGEVEVLDIKRRAQQAKALAATAQMLEMHGVSEEQIQASIAAMREQFDSLSTPQIKRIRKSAQEHIGYLTGISVAARTEVPASEFVDPSEEPPASVTELENTLDVDAEDSQPQTPSLDQDETETETETRLDQQEAFDVVLDGRKPKKLISSVNNVFDGVLTYEQRSALVGINDTQMSALVDAFSRTLGEFSRYPDHVPTHTDRLAKMLGGMTADQIAAAQNGGTAGSITSSFRKYLPSILREHKREFIEAYRENLAGEPIPEVAEVEVRKRKAVKVMGPSNETKEPEVRKKAERPEALSSNINNLFKDILSFDQRAAIPEFTPRQNEELVFLLDSLYERSAKKPELKDIQIARIEKSLDGMTAKEIAAQEDVHFLAVIQNFNKFLPFVFIPFKDEISAGFERIRAMSDGGADDENTAVDQSEQEFATKMDQAYQPQYQGDSQAAPESLPDDGDNMEVRIQAVRERLATAIPEINQQQIDQIISKAQANAVDNSPAFMKSLRDLYRSVSSLEVDDLPEKSLLVLNAFTSPRIHAPAMSVTEIRDYLGSRDPDNTEKYGNGFVTDTIIETLEVIIQKAAR
ncbi:MAG: hypothetical protein JWO07_744 [Candidatus Saccharibacteria bacterium]|nr:hypothetical protein [Candidatus Saccharibacteria bacterium]